MASEVPLNIKLANFLEVGAHKTGPLNSLRAKLTDRLLGSSFPIDFDYLTKVAADYEKKEIKHWDTSTMETTLEIIEVLISQLNLLFSQNVDKRFVSFKFDKKVKGLGMDKYGRFIFSDDFFINSRQFEQLKKVGAQIASSLGKELIIKSPDELEAEAGQKIFDTLTKNIKNRFAVDDQKIEMIRESLNRIKSLPWHEQQRETDSIRSSRYNPGIDLTNTYGEYVKSGYLSDDIEKLPIEQQQTIKELFVAEYTKFMNKLYKTEKAAAGKGSVPYIQYERAGGEINNQQYDELMKLPDPTINELEEFFRQTNSTESPLELLIPRDDDAFWLILWKFNKKFPNKDIVWKIIEAKAALGLSD